MPIRIRAKRRLLKDLVTDLSSIRYTYPLSALNSVYGSLNRLKVEHAWPKSPVKSGRLRSKWLVERTGPNSVALVNRTPYIYTANLRSRKPGFLRRIRAALPKVLTEELSKVGISYYGKQIRVTYRSEAALEAVRAPTPPIDKSLLSSTVGQSEGPVFIRVR